MLLAQAEGIVPALKVNDATKATLDLAQEAGEEKVFLFNLCGHFDLAAYESSTSPATFEPRTSGRGDREGHLVRIPG